MKTSVLFVALAMAVAGCTTKSSARRDAQAAFVAGQQQAMQTQSNGNTIQFIGDVKNPTVQWIDGMSLSQAIVAAEYQSERDPLNIVIFRRGQPIAVNPKDLLKGRDYLLEPGDRIELRR